MIVDFRYVRHCGYLFQDSLNALSQLRGAAHSSGHSSLHSNPSNNQQNGPLPPSSSKPGETMVRTDALVERLETLVANRSLYLRRDVEEENLPPPETKQRCTRCRHMRPISWFYKAPARNPRQAAALQPQDAPNPRPLRQLKHCRMCRRDSTTYQAQKKLKQAAPFDTDPRQTERCDLIAAKEQLKEGYGSNSSGVGLTR